MAVTLTGNGGLFTRLGQLFGIMKRLRLTQAELVNDSDGAGRCITDFMTALAPTTAFATDVEYGGQLTSDPERVAESPGILINTCINVAKNLLIEQVNADAKLEQKDLANALDELRRQMLTASASINGSATTFGTTAYDSGNNGDGVVEMGAQPSVVLAGAQSGSFPGSRSETLLFRCTKDAQKGEVTLGAEQFEILGEERFGPTSYQWPGGSGRIDRKFNSITANLEGKDRPNANLLMNSGFDRWVSGDPQFWEHVSGTIAENTTASLQRQGTSVLQFTGDGSTPVVIRQKLGDSTGSPVRMMPDTCYLIAIAARIPGHPSVKPTQGHIDIQLENSSGVLLTTAGATPQLSIAAATTSSTAWELFTAVVRTAKNLPDPQYLGVRERASSLLDSGKYILMTDLVVAPLMQIAPGGPFVSILQGNDPWHMDDKATIAVANDQAGAFATEFDRAFGMYESGLLLPMNFAGSETINDNLIP